MQMPEIIYTINNKNQKNLNSQLNHMFQLNYICLFNKNDIVIFLKDLSIFNS